VIAGETLGAHLSAGQKEALMAKLPLLVLPADIHHPPAEKRPGIFRNFVNGVIRPPLETSIW
jgi:hypothetical protein